ncbi:MAG TPA: hypothetical protein DCP28_09110 [Cytophagales bacterium]|nr:hypothetical protein [Cytophagales bacterium]
MSTISSLTHLAQTLCQGVQNNPLTVSYVGENREESAPLSWYSYAYWYPDAAGNLQIANTNYSQHSNNLPLQYLSLPASIMTPPVTAGAPIVGVTQDGQYAAVTDCSGFVSYLVQQAAPLAYQAIPRLADPRHRQPWPSALDYANLTQADHWQSILRITEPTPQASLDVIQAGDIIAYSLPNSPDTGHIMIATDTPKAPVTAQARVFRNLITADNLTLPEGATASYQYYPVPLINCNNQLGYLGGLSHQSGISQGEFGFGMLTQDLYANGQLIFAKGTWGVRFFNTFNLGVTALNIIRPLR